LTRAEFYAELKRLTAAPPKPEPKIAPIVVLTGLYEHTNKIALIKMLREIARYAGFSDELKKCKDIVDGLADGKPFTFNVKTAERRVFASTACALPALRL
jgi:ribosomal protein L7/L12